jgi:serine/threonine protein kinase
VDITDDARRRRGDDMHDNSAAPTQPEPILDAHVNYSSVPAAREEAPSPDAHALECYPYAREPSTEDEVDTDSQVGTCSSSLEAVAPTHQNQVRIAPPTRIRGYRIEEVLGTGGMAIVHRARDLATGRHVALKIMPDHLAHDERRVERFRREMRSNLRLDHENIVRVLDFGAEGQHLYLAVELVDGGSLHDVLGIAPRLPPMIRTPPALRIRAPS